MSIKKPDKALLLAAGFGKRLQPLTSTIPKPLLPLWNRPLIDHILLLLKKHGVQEVVVNAHWQADVLKNHLDNTDFDLKIHFSKEDEIRGTGGALLPWRNFFSDEPFWVINGDIAADIDLSLLNEKFTSLPGLIGCCWVTDKKGPRTVEVDYAGRITCYRSPDPGIDGTYTFCGAQLLSPQIFDYLPDRDFSTLVDAYENAMLDNHFLLGVNSEDSYWNDAGTLERYREIHKETKRMAALGRAGGSLYNPAADQLPENSAGFFCVGADVSVACDVKGRDSIVFNGAKLNEKTSLKNAVISGGVFSGSVNSACCIKGSSLMDDRVREAANALEWNLSDSAFEFIDRRGSNRSFWRAYNNDKRVIVVVDHGGRPDNCHYGLHTKLLNSLSVPSPELLYLSDDMKLIVLEDMGETSLTDKVIRNPDKTEMLYRDVIKEVANFHRKVTMKMNTEVHHKMEPGFDAELYAWEHSLFEEHLLQKRFGFEAVPDDVRRELNSVSKDLLRGSSVVIHRDLQSSNILYKGSRFVFIDYQGMRYGSPAYDLASLLYDPYVEIDSKLRCRLAAEYAGLCPEWNDVTALFFKAAVQRLIQSLGAFGRLSGLGHTKFENHILRGLQNLLEAADAAQFNALGGLIEELIARESLRV